MKRIAIVGASGTIGSAVARAFEDRGDEVIRLSRKSSPSLDLENAESIKSGLDAVGRVDALICTAGRASFGRLPNVSDEVYELGLKSKLMGQVRLVQLGAAHVSPGGAIILTSGMLAHHPAPRTAPVAMVNAAVETFVRAAALDLETIRLEVVCPPLVRETAIAQGISAEKGASASLIAETFVAAVNGSETGGTRFVPGYGAAMYNSDLRPIAGAGHPSRA